MKEILFYLIKIESNSYLRSSAMLILGDYYNEIENNQEEMLKYYFLSCKEKNLEAFIKVGNYYYEEFLKEERKKNSCKTESLIKIKRYYKKSIKLFENLIIYNYFNNYNSIQFNYQKFFLFISIYYNKNLFFSYANYFEKIQKNTIKMKEYYLLAIKLNYSEAMYRLGSYYSVIEKNYEEMKKYFKMAIDCNHSAAMHDLGSYFQDIEKNYEEMEKYYLMAIGINDK